MTKAEFGYQFFVNGERARMVVRMEIEYAKDVNHVSVEAEEALEHFGYSIFPKLEGDAIKMLAKHVEEWHERKRQKHGGQEEDD